MNNKDKMDKRTFDEFVVQFKEHYNERPKETMNELDILTNNIEITSKNKFDKSRSILQNGYVEYFNDQIHHSITAYVTVIGSEQGDGHLKSIELSHAPRRAIRQLLFR